MKKFIAVLVAFTLSLSTCVFAACGTDDPSGEVNPPSTEQPEPKPDAAKYSAQIEKAGGSLRQFRFGKQNKRRVVRE